MNAVDNNFETCPICDSGEFRPHSDGVFNFRHGRKTYSVENQKYAVCTECGTSGYLPGQRRENTNSIKKFQASLTDYISPSDVLSVREKYNLTQKQASQLFKGGVNGFSKWERGIAFPSAGTAMLLKVALESSDAIRTLAKVANVDFAIEIPGQDATPSLEDSKAVPLVVIQCTHNEYRDEVVDNDIENDSETKWNLLNQSLVSKTQFSLN
jgi:HTH-type transcriptional regulator/antitoxin MqsA